MDILALFSLEKLMVNIIYELISIRLTKIKDCKDVIITVILDFRSSYPLKFERALR